MLPWARAGTTEGAPWGALELTRPAVRRTYALGVTGGVTGGGEAGVGAVVEV
jgi:hypothetical protein